MSHKIKFVIPTVFTRKETEIQCVETICHQALKHNPENEVHMVCNFESPEFDQWKWVNFDELLTDVIPFKLKLYKQVVQEFRQILHQSKN